LLWENTLASNNYIRNVVNEFENEPRLGLLTTPQPYHGDFFSTFGSNRAESFKDVIKLAKKLKLNCILDEFKHKFSAGVAFWCRISAITALLEHNWNNVNLSEKTIIDILPYVAQHEGYYNGVVMTDGYTAIRISNFEKMVVEANTTLKIIKFCIRYPKVYIYGAGLIAKKIASLLQEHGIKFNGFIVSDGQKKQAFYNSYPIYYLSEINYDDATGIILGLSSKNKKSVVTLLEKQGINNKFGTCIL
jgi:rhamnosyltransferase